MCSVLLDRILATLLNTTNCHFSAWFLAKSGDPKLKPTCFFSYPTLTHGIKWIRITSMLDSSQGSLFWISSAASGIVKAGRLWHRFSFSGSDRSMVSIKVKRYVNSKAMGTFKNRSGIKRANVLLILWNYISFSFMDETSKIRKHIME